MDVDRENDGLGFFASTADAMNVDETRDDVEVTDAQQVQPGYGDAGERAVVEVQIEPAERTELFAPSLVEIETDSVTAIASANWMRVDDEAMNLEFNPALVSQIWNEELVGSNFSLRKVMLLDFSQYLERVRERFDRFVSYAPLKYLWPHYNPESAKTDHTLSIVVLLNEKFRERVSGVWNTITVDGAKFSAFFSKALKLLKPPKGSKPNILQIRLYLLSFLIHAFQSLENGVVRGEVLRLTGISIWTCLSEQRRENELARAAHLRKSWNKAERKYDQSSPQKRDQLEFDRRFLSDLIGVYLEVLGSIPAKGSMPLHAVPFCERFVELLIDLESQLPTRRYVNTLLDDLLVLQMSQDSNLAKRGNQFRARESTSIDWGSALERESGSIYVQLLDQLAGCMSSNVDDHTGSAQSESETTIIYHARIKKLQRLCFVKYREHLEDVALSSANFTLFRLESNYEIRQDIEDAVRRLGPQYNFDAASGESSTILTGWARMAAAVDKVDRLDVIEPNFGETNPSSVRGNLIVPEWLTDIFLGYGEPSSAQYDKVPNPLKKIDFRDTFLDWNHLIDSFAPRGITIDGGKNSIAPPFVVTFPDSDFETSDSASAKGAELKVQTYNPPNLGPYSTNSSKKNTIRFTPSQVKAIRSGVSPGLTLVVGPPGTGKTDVAVQIISNLYHNFPEQNILLVTHSNQALNQIFEKIVQLDIDPRHVLRLGHGMEEIDSTSDWGKYGRVNSFLEQRMFLLSEVGRLANTLYIYGEHGATCREFTAGEVVQRFPFHAFFATAPQPVFPADASASEALTIANGCYKHICGIFEQLDEIRAFELLRNSHDRSNYLLVKEAKIIALTCTYAALKRRELVALGFRYDSVVMEESAQILEIEAFIPLVLQAADPETGRSRLKRVVMIGDHYQLPPVVKNIAFQRYCNVEQSLFARFVRLGVPTVDLDLQGRCRPELADLFRWRYKNLGDLSTVQQMNPDYARGNAGFAFEYQVVNVEDYNGKGETEPIPHFLQNLGEAEYVVAVYQYMRLIGYPASQITILTTYNGQKALIEDVLERRCRWNPLFGLPAKVSTVDKFQGQQNNYILLSLVRTKTVGHLRDVRRLIVALSRARLGLYVFCRRKLYENCYELQPAFVKLMEKPSNGLWLRGKELHAADFARPVGTSGLKKNAKGYWKAVEDAAVFEMDDVAHMGKEHHLQAALNASQAGASAAAVVIPTPDASQLFPDYERFYTPTFSLPKTLIKFSAQLEDCIACPYCLDETDDAFLVAHRKKCAAAQDGLVASDAMTDDEFEVLMNALECLAGTKQLINESVSDEEAKVRFTECGARPKFSDSCLTAIFEYWKQRRFASGESKPVQPTLKTDEYGPRPETDPYVCFRRREVRPPPRTKNKKNDMAAFEKLKRLRQDLTTVRQVLELVLEREKKRRDSFALDEAIFDQRILVRRLRKKLGVVVEKDADASPDPRKAKKRKHDAMANGPTKIRIPYQKLKDAREFGVEIDARVHVDPHFALPEAATYEAQMRKRKLLEERDGWCDLTELDGDYEAWTAASERWRYDCSDDEDEEWHEMEDEARFMAYRAFDMAPNQEDIYLLMTKPAFPEQLTPKPNSDPRNSAPMPPPQVTRVLTANPPQQPVASSAATNGAASQAAAKKRGTKGPENTAASKGNAAQATKVKKPTVPPVIDDPQQATVKRMLAESREQALKTPHLQGVRQLQASQPPQTQANGTSGGTVAIPSASPTPASQQLLAGQNGGSTSGQLTSSPKPAPFALNGANSGPAGSAQSVLNGLMVANNQPMRMPNRLQQQQMVPLSMQQLQIMQQQQQHFQQQQQQQMRRLANNGALTAAALNQMPMQQGQMPANATALLQLFKANGMNFAAAGDQGGGMIQQQLMGGQAVLPDGGGVSDGVDGGITVGGVSGNP
ncbi:hypothetical protein HK101_002735 [Irineochytrium annulatum]|nr:hypothetical protein HK101_002735 [Irineochytrium annulatum]